MLNHPFQAIGIIEMKVTVYFRLLPYYLTPSQLPFGASLHLSLRVSKFNNSLQPQPSYTRKGRTPGKACCNHKLVHRSPFQTVDTVCLFVCSQQVYLLGGGGLIASGFGFSIPTILESSLMLEGA